MYEVYLDGKLLYYPGDEVNSVVSAILNTKLNDSGTFDVTIPRKNPLYGKFKPRVSELLVKKNGKEIWNGEVRGSKENLKKENVIHAVGELSYLGASSQPQKKYTNVNPLQMMTALVDIHNSQVEPRKQFTVGVVTVGNYNYDWITNYENTLDFMRKEMCDKLNGYLRIRKVDGVRYIDLVSLKDYGKSCEQPIKFGKNLLDYATGISSDAIATVVRPLGAVLENSSIEGIDSYLTIESVNDGKDYLENTDAIQSGIGHVWRTVHFNVLTTPEAVKTAGENWLKDNQFQNMTIDVTAIDLSEINSNIESFELGDSVRTIAKPFGLDRWSYVTEKKLDLLNPVTKHNISIGDNVKKTYTQQVEDEKNSLRKEIPQQSAMLQLAKQNASELIKNAVEGNIFFIYDEEGKPKELLIMDTQDIASAQKVWRWNINGLGYSPTGYNGEYALAMTMDGAIVADRITTGTLNSVRINNGDGKFTVDESGKFKATSGEIAGWDVTPHMLSKTVDLYDDMTEEGLADVGDNDPVQYIVWVRSDVSASATTPAFYIGYRPKSYYLSGGANWYNIFVARQNGEVVANKFKSSNAEINGGSINIGNDNFNLLSDGTLNAKAVNITGGDINIAAKNAQHYLGTRYGEAYSRMYPNLIWTQGSTGSVMIGAEGYIIVNDNGGTGGNVFNLNSASAAIGSAITRVKGNFEADGTAYFASSPVIGSDKEIKNSVEELDAEVCAKFIYSLKPSKYKYNGGTSDRFHHGFIAQEVKECMGEMDWGVYVDTSVNGDTEHNKKMLRYEELIADMVATIQLQNRQITKLEERLGITNG